MSCTQVICHRPSPAQPEMKAVCDSDRVVAFQASISGISTELQHLRRQQEQLQSTMERQHQELLQLLKDNLASNGSDEGFFDYDLQLQEVAKGSPSQEAAAELAEAAAPAAEEQQQERRSLQPQASSEALKQDPGEVGVSGPKGWRAHFQAFAQGYKFDLLMGLIIVLNMVVLFVELQMKGSIHLAFLLGVAPDNRAWLEVQDHFTMLEYVFTVAYCAELMIKLGLHRLEYLKDVIHIADAAIVIIVAIQVLGLGGAGGMGPNLSIFRIIKLFRIFRLFKVIKFMHHFAEVRILLNTMALSLSSLLWSILLMIVIILASGIFAFTMAADFIEDHEMQLEHREFMYLHFGSAARSSYTIWESTFSSGWTAKASYMVLNIHPTWAWFWVIYVVAVNFAIMRIIAALFIKKTLEVAAQDADRCAADRLKHKQQYAKALSKVFQLADTSGDGCIDVAEFTRMLENEEVVGMFTQLDVELPELRLLFDVLATDDGEADYDEFLAGALKMKNSARCIDAIQILHELGVNKRTSQSCLTTLEKHLADSDKRVEHLEQLMQSIRDLVFTRAQSGKGSGKVRLKAPGGPFATAPVAAPVNSFL